MFCNINGKIINREAINYIYKDCYGASGGKVCIVFDNGLTLDFCTAYSDLERLFKEIQDKLFPDGLTI